MRDQPARAVIIAAALLGMAPLPARAGRAYVLSIQFNGGFFWPGIQDEALTAPSPGGVLPSGAGSPSVWPFAFGGSLTGELRTTARQSVGLSGEFWATASPLSGQLSAQTLWMLNLLATWRYFLTGDPHGGVYLLLGFGPGMSIAQFAAGPGALLVGKVQFGRLITVSDSWALSLSADANGGLGLTVQPEFFFQPQLSLGLHFGSF